MGKLGGKIQLNLRAFGGLLARCKSAVFWQSKQDLSVFSTRTEKEGFAGFSLWQVRIKKGIGARIGLIFPHVICPRISGISNLERIMGDQIELLLTHIRLHFSPRLSLKSTWPTLIGEKSILVLRFAQSHLRLAIYGHIATENDR
jgi:hypothetical protein